MNKIQLTALILATVMLSSLATALVLREIQPFTLAQTPRNAKFIVENTFEAVNGELMQKWTIRPSFADDIPSSAYIEIYEDNKINFVVKELSWNGLPMSGACLSAN